MKHQKIVNLLDTTSNSVPRFVSKKRIEVYDQPGTTEDRHKPNKLIRFKPSMLRSDLCN